jgi:drug/metabolite transporter (DMT)-like permease
VKTLVVLIFAALSGAVAETLFSYGMRSFGEMDWSSPSRWMDLLLVVPRNSHVLIGVFFAAGYFFLYLAALSWADLSYAMPITALSFLFATLFAQLLLGEQVSWYRWAGTLLIVAGIALVVLEGRPRTRGTATAGPPRPGQEAAEGRR